MRSDSLPTYTLQDGDQLEVAIAYRSMEQIWDDHDGQPDEPHRHSYFTLVLVEKARGEHRIDFQSIELSDHQVFLLKPGQVHQLITNERPSGHVLVFQQQFTLEQAITCKLANPRPTGDACIQLSVERFHAIATYIQHIAEELEKQDVFFEASVGAWLKLIFVELDRFIETTEPNPHETHAGHSVYQQFFDALEKHYTELHKVNEYAQLMHLSASYLQEAISAQTGKSVKTHIQEKLALEAKRKLLFSDISGKELAFDLGFDDPAHFSKFFKKQTGFSITAFKEANTNH
jgi:AraC-like DNA-binding protein